MVDDESTHQPMSHRPATTPNKKRSSHKADSSHDSIKVFPRRKLAAVGGSSHQNHGPVLVSREALEELFELPLRTAAGKLGICITAIKRVCRKFGIEKWPYRIPCKGSENSANVAPNLLAPNTRTTRASSDATAFPPKNEESDSEQETQTQIDSPQRDSSASPTNVEQAHGFATRHSSSAPTVPYSLRRMAAKKDDVAQPEGVNKKVDATAVKPANNDLGAKKASQAAREQRDNDSIKDQGVAPTAPALHWEDPAVALNTLPFANGAIAPSLAEYTWLHASPASMDAQGMLSQQSSFSWGAGSQTSMMYPASTDASIVRSNSRDSFVNGIDVPFSPAGVAATCNDNDVDMGEDACNDSVDAAAGTRSALNKIDSNLSDGIETDIRMLDLEGNLFVSPLMRQVMGNSSSDHMYSLNGSAPSEATYGLYAPYAAPACGQTASLHLAAHKNLGGAEECRFGGGTDLEWLAAPVANVGDIMHTIFCSETWPLSKMAGNNNGFDTSLNVYCKRSSMDELMVEDDLAIRVEDTSG